LVNPMARLLGNALSDAAKRFLGRLKTWVGTVTFTSAEAKRRETSSKSAVYGWLSELHDAGVLELVDQARGRTPATWRLVDPTHEAEFGGLPEVETVFPNSAWTHGREAEFVGP